MMTSQPEHVRFLDENTGSVVQMQARVSVAEAELMLLNLVLDGLATYTVLESGQFRYTLTDKGRAAAKRAYEREHKRQ